MHEKVQKYLDVFNWYKRIKMLRGDLGDIKGGLLMRFIITAL